MRVRALAVVCLLVIAGCTAPTGTTGPASPPDHDEDPLGWEDGYWHNSSVAVDTSDGANRSELRAVTSRAMARVEHLRGLEFTDSVSVEVISRGEFRSGGGVGGSYGEWDDQVWEAAFLVGEDTTVDEAFDEVYGGSVAGYYARVFDADWGHERWPLPPLGLAALGLAILCALAALRRIDFGEEVGVGPPGEGRERERE